MSIPPEAWIALGKLKAVLASAHPIIDDKNVWLAREIESQFAELYALLLEAHKGGSNGSGAK